MKNTTEILREELGEKRMAELDKLNLTTLVSWAMIIYHDQFKNEETLASEKSYCQCGWRSLSIDDEYCEECGLILMAGI